MAAGTADRATWEQVRALLLHTVGESTFEIWLERLELIAVDHDGTLIISAPAASVGWVRQRFGRMIDDAAQHAGRPLRIADEAERNAAETLKPPTAARQCAAPVLSSAGAGSGRGVSSNAWRAGEPIDVSAGVSVDRSGDSRADQSPGRPAYARADMSAYPCSYTAVYNHQKEMS
jgi:hypothetical protein